MCRQHKVWTLGWTIGFVMRINWVGGSSSWLPGWAGDMGNWHPRVWRLSWLTIAITTKARNTMTFERGYTEVGWKVKVFHGCMVDIYHGHMRHVTLTGHASFRQHAKRAILSRSVARGITSKSLQNRYLHILESVPHSWWVAFDGALQWRRNDQK